MWDLHYKESWAPKNYAFELWCWRRLLRVPWTARRSNHSILKEINPEYSLGRTDAEAEAPIPWPRDMKNQLTGKDPDVGKDWGPEEKGATEDEMVGWHHWHNGHKFEHNLGDSKGQEDQHAAVYGVVKNLTRLSNRTKTTICWLFCISVTIQ